MKVKELLKELNNYKIIMLENYSSFRSKTYYLGELISNYLLRKKVVAYTINFENNILLIYYE